MADPSLIDPFAAPPLESDFFSDLPPSFSGEGFGDFDFTFDDIDELLNSDPDSDKLDSVQSPIDVADFLNVSSPDSPIRDATMDPVRVSDYPSPGLTSSQGSGNSGNCVSPGLDVSTNSANGIVDRKIKFEEESNKSALKRKKNSENCDSEINNSKFPRSNSQGKSDGDDQKKARLIRNRESAQLSRQRKKQYVEELEDKVRSMHSTINDLNARLSYVMAENASLRQQAYGMPPPGMYPWVPYPPYMVKPQGSQVPLVPIPKLKPQRPESAPKIKSKTKKVASVSLLGLLFFMVLFGGLAPMVNLKFREMHESGSNRIDDFNNGVSYYQKGSKNLTSLGMGKDFVNSGQCGNSSEPLVASLYVPRNDKLVKIDGNLIIHSIMASEKAMASNKGSGNVKKSEETGLALPNIVPLSGKNRYTHSYGGETPRALGGEKVKLISSVVDGKLQEWFMDGLAGPMLSSGVCTEVFQFDVSQAIVPVTSATNVSSDTQHLKNVTTKLTNRRNRRILPGTPVPLESNITDKHPEKDDFLGNNSSMVVSVLVDPREAGDGDGDGVMGAKSLSRIFVVVLIDSVKYVTYSCVLPRIGSGAHLTT